MLNTFISLLVLAFSLTTTHQVFGQDLLSDLPITKEEFIASEKKVLATIDWLETTPFEKEEEKRLKQKALLVAWITNSPPITRWLRA